MTLSSTRFTQHKHAGVAAIEFALVLPVLVLLLSGIINFGVMMYDQSVITNAAREGARWASIHSSATATCSSSFTTCGAATSNPTDPCQVACSYASGNLITFGSPSNLQVRFTTPGTYNSGDAMTVIMSYPYKGIGWYFGGNTQNLGSTAVMLHE